MAYLLSHCLRYICLDEGYAGSARACAAETSSVHAVRVSQQRLQRRQLHTADLRTCVALRSALHSLRAYTTAEPAVLAAGKRTS